MRETKKEENLVRVLLTKNFMYSYDISFNDKDVEIVH